MYFGVLMPGWGESLSPYDVKIEDCASARQAARKEILKLGEPLEASVTVGKPDAYFKKIGENTRSFNLISSVDTVPDPGSPSILKYKKEMPIGSLSNYINEQNRLREAAIPRLDPPDSSIVTNDREIMRDMQRQARDSLCTNQECKMESRYR